MHKGDTSVERELSIWNEVFEDADLESRTRALHCFFEDLVMADGLLIQQVLAHLHATFRFPSVIHHTNLTHYGLA